MTRSPADPPSGDDGWLTAVASAAAASSRVPVDLLGEYLPLLADAAINGRRPQDWELEGVRELGRRAAEQGTGAAPTVQLYLSAAWRLWRQLPVVVRSRDPENVRASAEAVLRVLDDAVAALVDGHQNARREMIRHEEALRREFVDDLLRGDADISRMVQRAEPFGIDLGTPHHVVLAEPREPDAALDRAAVLVERLVVQRFGDREVLVATKDGRIVVLLPGVADAAVQVGAVLRRKLERVSPGPWRVAAGRPFPGAYGVARSYEEGREALVLADRLGIDADVIEGRDLLVYRVVGRDQAAIADLVREVLAPLEQARGGPAVLLETLRAYFAVSEVATETARTLHVSVRTVTYRLARVAELTGYSLARPEQRFALQAAVLGARLLDWPAQALPAG